ncbi:MAG: NUDIX hydrolase, partial [Nitrospirales bacterium]|nr:NUDIX hydrolase [Nitrospirales bacterium]
ISDTLEFLYSYIHSNPYETEMVFTHACIHNGPFSFNREEIDEVKFWPLHEVLGCLGSGVLSDNFESEIRRYCSHRGSQ